MFSVGRRVMSANRPTVKMYICHYRIITVAVTNMRYVGYQSSKIIQINEKK